MEKSQKIIKSKEPTDYQEKKKELENLKKIEQQGKLKLFYADGSGFSMIPSVPYAWQETGTRIEIPSFKGKTLNLFGIWNAKENLYLYSVEGSYSQ